MESTEVVYRLGTHVQGLRHRLWQLDPERPRNYHPVTMARLDEPRPPTETEVEVSKAIKREIEMELQVFDTWFPPHIIRHA